MHRGVVVVACVTTAVLAGAAPGGATVDLTAIGTRIGDHPAFVRVVVDFTDGTINAPAVEATDPNPTATAACAWSCPAATPRRRRRRSVARA